MRKLATLAILVMPSVCATFTALQLCHAEPPPSDSRWGASFRAGTIVGHTQVSGEKLTTLGLEVGLGYNLGRFSIEGEYDSGRLLHKTGNGNTQRGELDRLGVNARFAFARLARAIEPDSMLRLFVEVGAGTQHAELTSGDSFWRRDTSVGGGWILDHRGQRPMRVFNHVGWQFGWRVTATPKASQTATARLSCRSTGGGCPDMEFGPGHDIGLTVSSSISFAW